MHSFEDLEKQARIIREDIIKMIYNAGSGHPGGSLSATEMIVYLYFHKMNIDPKNPQKPDRDRFILSKGHCNPVLYAALAEKGFFDKEILWTLRDINSILQGHPDMNKIPGIDMTTGSLGQGLSHGVGMALGARVNRLDYKVYVMLGDGELQEGQNWEAAMAAAHYNLDKLNVIVDNNGIQCDGVTREVLNVEPIASKFEVFGFDVAIVQATDFNEIDEAFNAFQYENGKPKCIVMDSVKGQGVSFMENKVCWHGGAPNKDQFDAAIAEIRGQTNEQK